MKHSKIPLSQTVVQLCRAKGIKHIVLSPGSRNAPLTIEFTHDDYFKCYSIVDERCAAFFALGIAQQIQDPVAIVCTSGSALLNYYPAIAEAYYSDIPLVVLSADRPKYLIGIGDGQTINQPEVFKNHILYSTNLKQDIIEEKNETDDELQIFKNIENKLEKFLGLQKTLQQENEVEINTALNISKVQKGPVHINIPLDEPLYEMVDILDVKPENIQAEVPTVSINNIDEFSDIWNNSKRKMVLVGVNQPNTVEQQYLDTLAKDESVVVFTETTSNLHHDSFFPSIDKVIAPLTDQEFKKLLPEVLLTFGGLIVSKKIKAFLRKHNPKHHWHVDSKKANDTFFCLNEHFKVDVNSFFKDFDSHTKTIKSEYRNYWLNVMQLRREKHERYLEQIPFSDFKVFDDVLKSIPDHTFLQVGNSSAVRYAQLFDLNKTLKVFCNRGTSGIDGSTSTAIGSASVTNKQTVFITGDLSFFYDSNALWNNYIPNNFRIIVVNNNGGGIFRILPGHKNTENFDTYFETQHNLTAKQLCDMYSFDYQTASNENELEERLINFYSDSNQPKLLEIFTPRTLNDSILLDYFKFIK